MASADVVKMNLFYGHEESICCMIFAKESILNWIEMNLKMKNKSSRTNALKIAYTWALEL